MYRPSGVNFPPATSVILSTPDAYRPSGVNLSPEHDTVTHMRNSHVQHGIQKHVLLDGVSSEAELCPVPFEITGSRKTVEFPFARRDTKARKSIASRERPP